MVTAETRDEFSLVGRDADIGHTLDGSPSIGLLCQSQTIRSYRDLRTITPVNSIIYGQLNGGRAAQALISGSDWVTFGGVKRAVTGAYLALLQDDPPLPSDIADLRLLDALGFPSDESLSREQIVQRECLLVLCQIPIQYRDDVLASKMTGLYHHGFKCCGLLSSEKQVATCTIRLRQSEQPVLLEATQSLCALLSTRRISWRTRRQNSSTKGASTSEVTESRPVTTQFGAIELKAVGGDLVARGKIIQLTSLSKAYRYILFDGAKRGLFLLGVFFVAVSAFLRFRVNADVGSVAEWLDGVVGRLATAAFGAQLVDSAIDYNSIAPQAIRRGFRFEAGAVIDWTWVDGRREFTS